MTSQMDTSSDLQLTSRVRRKLDQLKETSMERYVTREQRIVVTLNFCHVALERLEGWAAFAIFPADELNADKYIQFIEQRFQCVAVQLNGFTIALGHNKEDIDYVPNLESVFPHSSPQVSNHRSPPLHLRSSNSSTRHPSSNDRSLEPPQHDHSPPHPAPQPTQGPPHQMVREGPLCTRIAALSKRYVDGGEMIRRHVLARLARSRKEMHTVYQWGVSSLTDLASVLDEPMADELFFMVRGRMSRVLSEIGVFEEAAQEIERTMSFSQSSPGSSTHEDKRPERPVSFSQSTPGHSAPTENKRPERPVSFSQSSPGSSTHEDRRPERTMSFSQPSPGGSNAPNEDRRLSAPINVTKRASFNVHKRRQSEVTEPSETEGSELKDSGVHDLDLRLDLRSPTNSQPSSSRRESSSDIDEYLRRLRNIDSRDSRTMGRPHSVALGGRHDVTMGGRHDDDDDSISSQPEPPNSARPAGLFNHPRILKDKLHSSLAASLTSRSLDTSW